MTLPQGYSMAGYGKMIEAAGRSVPYAKALQAVVRPGSIVVDIGTGCGIFALLACRLGAAHVHAVDPSDAIQSARDIAAANGFADRITFHQGLSSALELGRRADVVVSDLRGVLPLFQGHVAAIADARERLLASGGTLVGRRDRIFAAPVQADDEYRPFVRPWLENDFAVDLRAAHKLAVNQWTKVTLTADALLAHPQQWCEIDYATCVPQSITGSLRWTFDRPGRAHGFAAWFAADLAPGVGFSCGPGDPPLLYGQAFFPFEHPFAVAAGDALQVRLEAHPVGGDYVWNWNTAHSPRDGAPGTSYSQSTFFGSALAPATLRRYATGHVPLPNPELEIARFCLARVDGHATLGEIAQAVHAAYPARFASTAQAQAWASEFLRSYSTGQE